MEIKTFKKGEILFRAGDPGNCMYDVYSGTVGVYTKYGTPGEKLLKKYFPDEYFGEMGLIDQAPRSATAVALESNTTVALIDEAGFGEFFEKNPARVLMVMQHLSANLRRRTKEYIRVCEEIRELEREEEQK
jgi:CRP-like cAMP-binding protein